MTKYEKEKLLTRIDVLEQAIRQIARISKDGDGKLSAIHSICVVHDQGVVINDSQ